MVFCGAMKGGVVPQFCTWGTLVPFSRLLITITSQKVSKHLLTRSVCGWKAVLLFNMVSMAENKAVEITQKILIPIDNVDFGIPCLLTTLSINTSATCFVVKGCLRGMKWFWYPY